MPQSSIDCKLDTLKGAVPPVNKSCGPGKLEASDHGSGIALPESALRLPELQGGMTAVGESLLDRATLYLEQTANVLRR